METQLFFFADAVSCCECDALVSFCVTCLRVLCAETTVTCFADFGRAVMS